LTAIHLTAKSKIMAGAFLRLKVNLWGVIHGVRVFVPILLEQDTESHIVNTASISGLISIPGLGVYQVTKYGIVSLSETLYHELAQKSAKVKVSVLCPGFVNTGIMEAERNRPDELQNASAEAEQNPANSEFREAMRQAVQAGISPDSVADYVFQAIRDEKFYILTDATSKQAVQIRLEEILQDRNPTNLSPM
jgi:short-subunit dehydrogenase